MPLTTYFAEYAWLPTGTARDVLFGIDDGTFVTVEPGSVPSAGATRLRGLTLPGLANVHSHAFHRALRGRTHSGGGTFWTWREQMYALAGTLSPETYQALARATFAEMALAGITCVGEFHYLHHAPGGKPYSDPNEMGHRLLAAAAEAGIRITLLDTLYLTSTVDGKPVAGAQLRFSDSSVDGWSSRVDQLTVGPGARRGAAAHSVRAVPPAQLALLQGRLMHIHLSEQPAENQACLARYGLSPTELLNDCGLIGPNLTAVHATHLSTVDVHLLGDANVCLCPTTERDLADGIGPARALAEAGASLCLGSDSHAMIEPFEEARALELNERLVSLRRGAFATGSLLAAATDQGHAALGWPDAGRLEVGARADLVTVRLDTVQAAGIDDPAAAAVFVSSAADVTDVVVDGRLVVHKGQHQLLPDVAGAMGAAVATAWAEAAS